MRARKAWVGEVCQDWLTLNAYVMEMTTEDVLYALVIENERARPRKTFLKRLKQRYNGIRAEEIQGELG